MMNIAVIGAANIDISAKPYRKYVPYDSNPGKISISLGGVGRNISHNLVLLGQNVTFLTALGGDLYAQKITDSCSQIGIDLSRALRCPDMESSVYLCVNDERGDLMAGVSDMELCTMISSDYIRNNIDFINSCDAAVFDTNLTEETIAYIMSEARIPLFCDTVSTRKAEKLAHVLEAGGGRIHTLKANRYEAGVLAGIEVTDTASAEECAKILANRGAERVCITLGADGVLAYDGDKTVYLPCPETHIVNATGAGDSFLASLLLAHSFGLSLEESARLGQAAAKLTLESDGAVSEKMSARAILESAKITSDNGGTI